MADTKTETLPTFDPNILWRIFSNLTIKDLINLLNSSKEFQEKICKYFNVTNNIGKILPIPGLGKTILPPYFDHLSVSVKLKILWLYACVKKLEFDFVESVELKNSSDFIKRTKPIISHLEERITQLHKTVKKTNSRMPDPTLPKNWKVSIHLLLDLFTAKLNTINGNHIDFKAWHLTNVLSKNPNKWRKILSPTENPFKNTPATNDLMQGYMRQLHLAPMLNKDLTPEKIASDLLIYYDKYGNGSNKLHKLFQTEGHWQIKTAITLLHTDLSQLKTFFNTLNEDASKHRMSEQLGKDIFEGINQAYYELYLSGEEENLKAALSEPMDNNRYFFLTDKYTQKNAAPSLAKRLNKRSSRIIFFVSLFSLLYFIATNPALWKSSREVDIYKAQRDHMKDKFLKYSWHKDRQDKTLKYPLDKEVMRPDNDLYPEVISSLNHYNKRYNDGEQKLQNHLPSFSHKLNFILSYGSIGLAVLFLSLTIANEIFFNYYDFDIFIFLEREFSRLLDKISNPFSLTDASESNSTDNTKFIYEP